MKAQVLHKYDPDLSSGNWVSLENVEDPKIQKSLEELGFHTVSLDILGVYEASEYRKI